MDVLANKIAKASWESKQCGVYEPELSRGWPTDGEPLQSKLADFAEVHGWWLRYYKEGFCAIFDKDTHR